MLKNLMNQENTIFTYLKLEFEPELGLELELVMDLELYKIFYHK